MAPFKKTTKPRKTYKKRVIKRKPASTANIKRIVNKMILKKAESKSLTTTLGYSLLYHNVDKYIQINATSLMPVQGTGDTNRIGDKINVGGFYIRLMCLQKADRKNINWTIRVISVPKGTSLSYSTIYKNIAGNAMIDQLNEDVVKVLYSRRIRQLITPDLSGTGGADKELTFFHKFFIKYPRVYSFITDNSTTHQDRDIYLQLLAYDTYGTLITDNIGNVQAISTIYYKDP